MNKCDTCTTEKTACETCRDNPKYAKLLELRSNYCAYERTCPFGYINCVLDPGYIQKYHHEDYKELFGDVEPMQAMKDSNCYKHYNTKDNCEHYDDEDK